ncbi:methyltransferase domain-containing protein [Blastococcus sp. SYSU D00813]
MSARLKAYLGRIDRLRAPAPMQDFSDYDAYWRERGELGVVHERWRVAAELIPDGATVLDVGCGSGEFLAYLKRERPGVEAVGADFSDASVDMVRKRGLEAFRLDLSHEDVPGTFDYITCFETLEHIPDAETAVLKLTAAARRQVIVSVPNVGYLDSRIRLALFGRFPNTNLVFHVKEHVRHWTVKDFHEWAHRLGLRVVLTRGQYGGRLTPWRTRPSLWSAGAIYVLEAADPTGRSAA